MPGKVVSPAEWLSARKALLIQEKAQTRANDAVTAQLRDFPMVKVTKTYNFSGPSGPATLSDLFQGQKQLIVYHFMFGPDAEAGCTACSFFSDHIPNLAHLKFRDTQFVAVSRGPLEKIEPFKERMGWTFPWYSSFGSDFNYDFHVTLDSEVTPRQYNYKDSEEKDGEKGGTELPGLSVFFMGDDGDVYHTYSSYARGLDKMLGTYTMLDYTPLGRQDSQDRSINGLFHHDSYPSKEDEAKQCCH